MRANLEKYYTPATNITECVEMMKKHINITDIRLVDPCAGDGRWKEPLLTAFPSAEIFMSDIEPDSDTVIKVDFLSKTNIDVNPGAVFVTNPPFGKNCSLAKKIFKRAADYKPKYICLLVPENFADRNTHSGYKLVAMEKITQLHFERTDGVVYDDKVESPVVTTFQIWAKGSSGKEKLKRLAPKIVTKVGKDGGLYTLNTYQGNGYTLYRPTNHKITSDSGKTHEVAVGERGLLDGIANILTITTHGTLAGTISDFNPSKDKVSVRQFIVPDSLEIGLAIKNHVSPESFTEQRCRATIKHNPSINPSDIIKTVDKILANILGM